MLELRPQWVPLSRLFVCLLACSAGGAVKLRSGGLCLGAVGTCKCSNPPSPRMGLVDCKSSDATQHWMLDPETTQLMNNPKHDLNSGPVCKGDAGNSMLLYPAQGHPNEKYSHNSATGAIQQGSRCLVVTGAPVPSPPPAPPPRSRTISVSWAQLGWGSGSKVIYLRPPLPRLDIIHAFGSN